MVEENIEIDPALTNRAFQRGLKIGKELYLNELQSRALEDYELEGEEEIISKSFMLLSKYIKNDPSCVESLQLDDWSSIFNLSKSVQNRIGYLAYQIELESPAKVEKNRHNSRGFSKANSSLTSSVPSEIYDEDEFEQDDLSARSLSDEKERFMDGSATVVMKVNHRSRYSDNEAEQTFSDEEEDASRHSQSAPKTYSGRPSNNVKFEHKSNNNKMRPKSSAFEMQMKKEEDLKQRAATAHRLETRFDDEDIHRGPNTSGPNTRQRKSNKTPSWILNGNWKLGESIGSGSFGEVFRGMNDKGKLFAVKRLNLTEKNNELESLKNEILLMRGLSHPHIVEYLGASVDLKNPVMYIFLELVPGGSVQSLLKNFGPFGLKTIRIYTRQILLGLEYLHSHGIVHRDIKGGNILVDDNGSVKLADFGASTQISFDKTQETTSIKGTPYFMAPEVLSNSKYGRKGDIWAVGCTMIQMLTGEPPWKDMNIKGLVQLHLLLNSWNKGPPPFDCQVSPECRECLEYCFQKNEELRPSAKELLNCSFLTYEDDLEDSRVSYGFENSLEDSGALTDLRREMDRAVSRSAVGLGGKKDKSEDTVTALDRQIQERQARRSFTDLPVPTDKGKHQAPPSSQKQNPFGINYSKPKVANPFGINGALHSPAVDMESIKKQLPPPNYEFSLPNVDPNRPSNSRERIESSSNLKNQNDFADQPNRNLYGEVSNHGQSNISPKAVQYPLGTNQMASNTKNGSMTDQNKMVGNSKSGANENSQHSEELLIVTSSGKLSKYHHKQTGSDTSYQDYEIISAADYEEDVNGGRDSQHSRDSQSGSAVNTPSGNVYCYTPRSGIENLNNNYDKEKLALVKKKANNFKTSNGSSVIAGNEKSYLYGLKGNGQSEGMLPDLVVNKSTPRNHYNPHNNITQNQSSNRDSEDITPLPLDGADYGEEELVRIHRPPNSRYHSEDSNHGDEIKDVREFPAIVNPNQLYRSSTVNSLPSSRRGSATLRHADSDEEREIEIIHHGHPTAVDAAEIEMNQLAPRQIFKDVLDVDLEYHNNQKSSTPLLRKAGTSSQIDTSVEQGKYGNESRNAINTPTSTPTMQSTSSKSGKSADTRSKLGAAGALSVGVLNSNNNNNNPNMAVNLTPPVNNYNSQSAVGSNQTKQRINYTSLENDKSANQVNGNPSSGAKQKGINTNNTTNLYTRSKVNTSASSNQPAVSGSNRISNSISSSALGSKPSKIESARTNPKYRSYDNDDESVVNDEAELWTCAKCNGHNSIKKNYCIHCATVRGSDGKRGEYAAPLYRVAK